MATPDTTVVDPFDSATEAKAPSAEYYGELVLDAWHCVLEKGTGKRPFNAQADDPAQRRTAVDMVILPLAELNIQFPLERKVVAESNSWTKVTWPSLQKLGLSNAKEAKNKFCHAKLSPTGRKYTDKSGDSKEETTFEFVELFADEAACRAAYTAKHGGATPAPQAAQPANPAPTGDPAKQTAFTFAKAIVTNLARAEKDPIALQTKVAEKISTMPMVSAHFTGDSPEIMQMIAEALAG